MKVHFIQRATRLGLFVLLLGIGSWSFGCRREAAPPASQEEDDAPQVELPADDATTEPATSPEESDADAPLDLNRPEVEPRPTTPDEDENEPDGGRV